MQLVEPVFGIIKEQQQAHRFLLRGLPNVSAEWSLLATAFNLRTLWRVWRATAPRTKRWEPEVTRLASGGAVQAVILHPVNVLLRLMGPPSTASVS